MDSEATKILNPQQDAVPQAEQKIEEKVAQPKVKKGSGFGARTAATAAGAALGTSAAMAAEHIYDASTGNPEEEAAVANAELIDEATSQGNEEVASAETANITVQQTTPSEQDAIVATDEGLHVAHVDDSLSFSEAFAEARSQVGAGGVFEWHGKVYGTYYEEEWNNMSAAERAEWQSKVDYSDVIDPAENHVASTSGNAGATSASETIPADATYVDTATAQQAQMANENADNEVHVVGVAIQDNGQGGVATLAGLQSGDEMAVIVDVDSDGTIDIIGIDANNNGQIEANEMHEAGNVPFSTAEVVGAYVAEAHAQGQAAIVTDLDNGNQYQITHDGDGYGLAAVDEPVPDENVYLASADEMPDYMNDADPGFLDA